MSNDVTPNALARWLVDRQLLTGWQAEELLRGRRDYFLGKYKLLERIGQGGSGTVYRCEQTGMDRIVAVKVLSEEVAKKPGAVARFQQEARLAARVNHINVVAAFDAEHHGDIHFLVMEYVPGHDLNRWIKASGGKLPIDWACEVVRQAAIGLQHAHDQGLVHRDVKPGNLLVKSDSVETQPEVKVLDLGFARLADHASEGVRLTHAWQIFGTPDYMAPEQAESTKNADARSDIYALGCTLFKALTGEPVFPGSTPVQKLLAKANSEPPLIRSKRASLPGDIERIVSQMLKRNPDERFQRAQDVAEALLPFSMERAPGSSILSRMPIDFAQAMSVVQPAATASPTPVPEAQSTSEPKRSPRANRGTIAMPPPAATSAEEPSPPDATDFVVVETPTQLAAVESGAAVARVAHKLSPPAVQRIAQAGLIGGLAGAVLGGVVGVIFLMAGLPDVLIPLLLAAMTIGSTLSGIATAVSCIESLLADMAAKMHRP
jgi:serine/threonine protein kinase